MDTRTSARQKLFDLACYYLETDPAAAIPYAEKVLSQNPDDSLGFYAAVNLGRCYYKVGHYEAAIRINQQVIEQSPNHEDPEKSVATIVATYYLLGSCYLKMNLFQETLVHLTSAIDLNTEFANGYYRRGRINLELGRYKDALRDYKTAYQLNPSFNLIHYALGLATIRLAEQKTSKKRYRYAAKHFEMALQQDPTLAESYFLLGKCYYYLDRFNAAVTQLKSALQFGYQYAELFLLLGASYSMLDDHEQSLQHLDHAVFLEPRNARIYKERALLHEWVADYQLALADLDHAIRLAPDNVAYKNVRERIAADKEDYDEKVANIADMDETAENLMLEIVSITDPSMDVYKLAERARRMRGWSRYALPENTKVQLCDLEPIASLLWFHFCAPKIIKNMNFDMFQYISSFVTGLTRSADIRNVALTINDQYRANKLQWIEQGLFGRKLRMTPQRIAVRKKIVEREHESRDKVLRRG